MRTLPDNFTNLVSMSGKARELRFLVVDDNEDIRDVFCRLVERAGHVASTASDGQEAVEILQVETFDVMLLDLTMPRMNGVDVVRWLRAHPDVAPDLKIVVISAWAGEHRAVLQELGIVTVMQKPLRIQQLTDLISETLRDTEF
jgi:CheY-like chemotaxis protein